MHDALSGFAQNPADNPRYDRSPEERPPWISVVIPVYRDGVELERRREELGTDPRFELIVEEGACRAGQMNRGAERARGEWLLFLHADTQLPSGWLEELKAASRDPQVIGGHFRLRIASSERWARLIEWGVAARVRVFALPYGDQAFFVRRDTFRGLGGFRDIPLMEDVDFARRLHRAGKVHRSHLEVTTSARRWERDGWLRRTFENVLLVCLFFLRVRVKYLAQVYRPQSARVALAVPARAPCEQTLVTKIAVPPTAPLPRGRCGRRPIHPCTYPHRIASRCRSARRPPD